MMLQSLQLEGFHYKVADATATRPDKTVTPIKVLALQDKNNPGVCFNFIFTVPEFTEFIKNISGKKIVSAKKIPDNIIQFPKQ